MRLYGKRFIRRATQLQVADRAETRDALVWEVNRAQRWCGVVVQNANLYRITKAFFPSGWMEVPQWLKPGNSVRITHTGGVRGRIEVVSQGILSPRPVGGASMPPPGSPSDAVIWGLALTALPVPEMRVAVTPGIVRFSGIQYELPSIYMDTPDYEMGMGGQMDDGYRYVSPTCSVPTNFRYVLFVIGSDFVIDRIYGNDSTTPTMPAVPSGHLKIGHVLTYNGMTSIVGGNIGATWTAPFPATVQMTIADNDLLWTQLTTTINVAVKTQYGGGTADPDRLYKLQFLAGNGKISYSGQESTSYLIVQSASSSVTFTYTRNQQDPGDISPSFMASIPESTIVGAVGNIILRNAAGNPMY